MSDSYTLRVAVCEDDPDDAARLIECIGQTGTGAETRSFESAEALMQTFSPGQYDLIFMDIYMSGETGVSASRKIRDMDKNVCLAFTTSSLDHALESYRVGALKYLEKPVKPEGVTEILELALMKKKSRPSIALTKAGGGQENMPLDAILYFEQQKHIVEAHTSSGTVTTSRLVRLDELEKRLPSPPFIRTHHSFIVNLDYVREADKERQVFVMEDGGLAHIRRGKFGMCEEALKLRVIERAGRDDL
jgi:DNA-binding LytR/AlgR family response regulator